MNTSKKENKPRAAFAQQLFDSLDNDCEIADATASIWLFGWHMVCPCHHSTGKRAVMPCTLAVQIETCPAWIDFKLCSKGCQGLRSVHHYSLCWAKYNSDGMQAWHVYIF